MKTSELTGAALDWAVAKCEGIGIGPRGSVVYYHEGEPAMWQPSTDPSQAYPIIFREKIAVVYRAGEYWLAYTHENYQGRQAEAYGPTPLIAAMRCYVASKLGDDVDVPEELNHD
jgi:hypothetical protein